MKRILFVHSSNEMYGADRMLLRVLYSLREMPNVQVEVWLPNDVSSSGNPLSDHLTRAGVKFVVLPMPILRRRYMTVREIPGLVRRFASVAMKMKGHKPDVVFCTTSATLAMAPIARVIGVRSVVLHAQELWSGRESAVLTVFGIALTRVISISDSVERNLRGPARGKSQVIVNAVPDDARPMTPLAGRVGPVKFLVASRWNDWKGHRTLLAAWKEANAPGKLTILGAAPPIGEGVDVASLVRTAKFEESVEVVGEVHDIGPYIDSHDYLIVPSDTPEPFGLVAIEAFARARPVIGSNAGGLAVIIDEGITGRLFPLQGVHELAAILENASRRQAVVMGQRARESYVEKYSTERYGERLREFWHSLL